MGSIGPIPIEVLVVVAAVVVVGLLAAAVVLLALLVLNQIGVIDLSKVRGQSEQKRGWRQSVSRISISGLVVSVLLSLVVLLLILLALLGLWEVAMISTGIVILVVATSIEFRITKGSKWDKIDASMFGVFAAVMLLLTLMLDPMEVGLAIAAALVSVDIYRGYRSIRPYKHFVERLDIAQTHLKSLVDGGYKSKRQLKALFRLKTQQDLVAENGLTKKAVETIAKAVGQEPREVQTQKAGDSLPTSAPAARQARLVDPVPSMEQSGWSCGSWFAVISATVFVLIMFGGLGFLALELAEERQNEPSDPAAATSTSFTTQDVENAVAGTVAAMTLEAVPTFTPAVDATATLGFPPSNTPILFSTLTPDPQQSTATSTPTSTPTLTLAPTLVPPTLTESEAFSQAFGQYCLENPSDVVNYNNQKVRCAVEEQ